MRRVDLIQLNETNVLGKEAIKLTGLLCTLNINQASNLFFNFKL